MKIGNNWQIISDDLNIVLSRRHKVEKTGKEYWTPEGYYSSLASALKALVAREIRGTGLKDFETVVKKLAELEAKIDLALRKGCTTSVGADKGEKG